MDVSIVIPTKNGGHLFEKVLDAVFKQKTEYEYEVICVDSGSKDGTLDVIRKIHAVCFRLSRPNLDMEKRETMVLPKEMERISSLLRRMRFRRPILGCRISLMP